MKPGDKLVLIVREDLRPGQQAVQAAHAFREFVSVHTSIDLHWFEVSNTLALLAVPDETSLGALFERAAKRGVRGACFREPDLNNSLTALCLEPGEETRRITKGLPLALRE